jgi:hypothetical protein
MAIFFEKTQNNEKNSFNVKILTFLVKNSDFLGLKFGQTITILLALFMNEC